MVRFAKWHPLVQFCFLLCVLLLTCLSRHPVPVALSLLGAAVYLLLTDGRRSLRSLLCVPVRDWRKKSPCTRHWISFLRWSPCPWRGV